MGTRMHYGHPDFVDGFWARNRGGMSHLDPDVAEVDVAKRLKTMGTQSMFNGKVNQTTIGIYRVDNLEPYVCDVVVPDNSLRFDSFMN